MVLKKCCNTKRNPTKYILHYKLSSSLKKGSTIIIWTEQIVSGHNVLQWFKTVVSHHLTVIFIHKLGGGYVPSLVAEKPLTMYCPGFSLELEVKMLCPCPTLLPQDREKKNKKKPKQKHWQAKMSSQQRPLTLSETIADLMRIIGWGAGPLPPKAKKNFEET